MPRFDFLCPACAVVQENVWAAYKQWPVCACGAQTEPYWATSFPNIIGDEIPGGMTIHNMTATPETFYSKSEHRRRVKELGLTIKDRHVGHNHTDKSPHTSRWV